ncbi:nuclear protein [Coccidioides immitis RS]|uniref:Nuclear protein n=1 Tax=Coccidioides immitis (strain RS) TaxID=246410 RepID=J3KFX1_COCIM|nr:nuclear protein [Coccidioides immitis RS]EAS34566.3 nuclear protein [Coccidioides immitis RS]TPX21984.1 suppressor of glycerol defect [Coccidioides immitis]
MPRPAYNTTQLPRQLREELGLKDTITTGARSSNPHSGFSRKERRKAERSRRGPGFQQRKGHKRRQRSQGGDGPEDDVFDEESGRSEDERPAKPKTRTPAEPRTLKSILKRMQPVEQGHEESDVEIDLDEGENEDETPEAENPPPHPKISRSVQKKLEEDDAEIAALEKKLGLKGKKKLPKSFLESGLGDILGELGSDSEIEAKKRKREGEEWLQRKRQRSKMIEVGNRDEEEITGSEDAHEDEEDFDEMLEDFDDDDDDDSVGEGDSEFQGFDDEEEEEEEEESAPQKTKQKENPYRPPVAASDTAPAKYIPPSKRMQSSTESESLLRLRRQIQGHLNKLSEANIISILGDMEKLYQDYPRQSVTSVLIDILFGLVCSGSSLNDTFIILHAGFIAAIYKVIGMEFGAEFVQNLVQRFDSMYEEKDKGESSRKDMVNLLSLLSHLYNFHLLGCGLVFDYIRLFLGEINELNTELLLKVVRNSGPQLRQDDPSALKDIVLLIQPAVAQIGEAALSVRTKFMIETITDLKNNKLKNAPGASISLEHLTKMRKILGSLNSRSLRASEPLRIGRADIQNSDKRGKWWLVGASWKADSASTYTHKATVDPSAVLPDNLDNDLGDKKAMDLAQLARSHRMNTEVRRSIFVAIMSASDYQDAHVRLTKLRLKRSQETEIPQVLVHCASEEGSYNPYYTLIARKLCGERKMKMAFQFSLWDVFKRMGESGNMEDDDFSADEDEDRSLTTRAIVNLAKMYGSLIADGGLTLGILKTLDFLYLQPKTRTFVELLLITTMQQTQQKSLRKQQKAGESTQFTFEEKPLVNVFLKARDTPQVVTGLIYFIRKVVAKSDVVASRRDKKLLKWGCKLALDTLKVISEGAGS